MTTTMPTTHVIPNGTFTVASPDASRHFTAKIHTAATGKLAGRRIVSMLTGSNNETDYSGVAFWDDEKRCAATWQRFKGPLSHMPIDGLHWQEDGWSTTEKKLAVLVNLMLYPKVEAVAGAPLFRGSDGEAKHASGYWASAGYTLLCEARCIRCNRVLTTPESITLGLGPECAQRV